jgi:hypothetical protein
MSGDANCGVKFVDARDHLGVAIEDVLGVQASDHPDTKFSKTLPHRIWVGIVYAPVVSIVLLIITGILNYQFVVGSLLAAVVLFSTTIISVLVTLRYNAAESGELFRQLQDIMKQYVGSLESGRAFESQAHFVTKNITSGHSNVSIVAVYRDQFWQRIPSLLLVDGDIIALTAGDITPGKVFELISDRTPSYSPSVIPPWPAFGAPLSPLPPSPRPSVSMLGRRGWQRGQCMEGGVKIHLREERRKYAITPVDVTAAYAAALAAAVLESTGPQHQPDSAERPKRGRGQSFDTQCRDRRLESDSCSPMANKIRSGSYDSPRVAGDTIRGSHPTSGERQAPSVDYKQAGQGADNSGDRHKHTRAINNQSSELLTLSGDMRCFVLAETPVRTFCRDVLSQSRSPPPPKNKTKSSPSPDDSYLRALFVSVFDDSRTVMWWLLGLSLVATAVRLALVPESRSHFIGMVSECHRLDRLAHIHHVIDGVLMVVGAAASPGDDLGGPQPHLVARLPRSCRGPLHCQCAGHHRGAGARGA